MNKAVYAGVGLLLGALFGFLVGAYVTQDTPHEGLGPSTSQVDSDESEEVEAPVETPAPPANPPLPTASGTLADIIANADVPKVPSGSGQISGKILTKAGEPVPGVKVSARSSYPDSRSLRGKSIVERISEEIKYERWRELSKHETTTDTQGSYVIEGLHETEEYGVWASLEGWRIDKYGSGKESAGETIDFVATQIFSVSIEVRMPDGSLANKMYVEFSGTIDTYDGYGTYVKDGMGKLRLSADEWTFSGTYGQNEEYSIEKNTVTIGPESTIKKVVLQLKGRPGVSGAVKVSSEYKDETLKVYLIKDPPADAPGDIKALLEDGPESEYLWNSGRWRPKPIGGSPEEYEDLRDFAFLDIDAGPYRLILVLDDKIIDWADVTIGENIETVNLELPEPEITDYIVVAVSAPNGNRLKYIAIRLGIWGRYGSCFLSRAGVVSGENNEYWVHRTTPDNEDEATQWTYQIEVKHKFYGTLTKNFSSEDTSVQEFQFQEPATVTLMVPGYNDHKSRKQMRWTLQAGRWFGDGDGDEIGVDKKKNKSPITFGPMQPGKYVLVLKQGDGFRKSRLYREEFTIQSGENPITVAMPQIYTFAVACKDNSEARELELSSKSRLNWFAEFDSTTDGNTTAFTGIAAGEYILETATGRMKITVPTNGVVDFRPKEYDCMVISDIKSGGIIEGMGLMNNDKLIEMDGVGFSDADLFQAQLRVALSKESTTWLVLRNGIQTSVTFNGKLLTKTLKNKKENGEDIDFDQGYRDK